MITLQKTLGEFYHSRSHRAGLIVSIFARTIVGLGLLQFFYFGYKLFGWLEGWDIVLRNMNSYILLDVAAYLGGAFLGDKTSETTDIDVLPARERVLPLFEHGFEGNQNINFGYPSFVRNLVNEIGFSHLTQGFRLFQNANLMQKKMIVNRIATFFVTISRPFLKNSRYSAPIGLST